MELACPQCGKVRKYRPATIAKLKSHLCIDCSKAADAASWMTLKCPHCGRETSVPPNQAKRYIGYCLNCPRYTPNDGLPDNYDAGYVLGVVMGDGCISKIKTKNSHEYVIRLGVLSEAFAQKFRNHLGACLGRKPWIGSHERDMKACPEISMPATHIIEHIVHVRSREWYDILKPYKKDRNLDDVLTRSKEFREGFFQGMLDSEGYVNPKYTDIAGKDLALLGVVKQVLESLGERANIIGPYPYSRGVAHLRTRSGFAKTA